MSLPRQPSRPDSPPDGSPGNARPGSQPDRAQPDRARPDTAQPDRAQPDRARPDTAQPDRAQPDRARPDTAQPDRAQPERARPDTGSGGPAAHRQAGSRLAAGIVLLLLAVVLFGASRVIAAGQRHAYDPGASPSGTYSLTAGTTYQLSSARSVAQLKAAGLLSDLACYQTLVTGEQTPVTLASTADDDRNLHVFATLVAPSTATVRLSCTGIADVFVDDADSAAPDRSAPLLLASMLAGLLGVIAACSGGYRFGGGYGLGDRFGDREARPAGHRSPG